MQIWIWIKIQIDVDKDQRIYLPEPVDDVKDDEEEGHCDEEKSGRKQGKLSFF